MGRRGLPAKPTEIQPVNALDLRRHLPGDHVIEVCPDAMTQSVAMSSHSDVRCATGVSESTLSSHPGRRGFLRRGSPIGHKRASLTSPSMSGMIDEAGGILAS